ncbi:hypothetical protein PsorP6_002133 [Peronosclerospora sorghi]|uniref:Uncharacterized protein n=1 Tax=Peronosclerospora sorghi TaxID=230839 RepID=A0ACC0WTY2_9STRA|nr:hypothetical protein PsorP6_002133 [Peronosclerospora sorghi]
MCHIMTSQRVMQPSIAGSQVYLFMHCVTEDDSCIILERLVSPCLVVDKRVHDKHSGGHPLIVTEEKSAKRRENAHNDSVRARALGRDVIVVIMDVHRNTSSHWGAKLSAGSESSKVSMKCSVWSVEMRMYTSIIPKKRGGTTAPFMFVCQQFMMHVGLVEE